MKTKPVMSLNKFKVGDFVEMKKAYDIQPEHFNGGEVGVVKDVTGGSVIQFEGKNFVSDGLTDKIILIKWLHKSGRFHSEDNMCYYVPRDCLKKITKEEYDVACIVSSL